LQTIKDNFIASCVKAKIPHLLVIAIIV